MQPFRLRETEVESEIRFFDGTLVTVEMDRICGENDESTAVLVGRICRRYVNVKKYNLTDKKGLDKFMEALKGLMDLNLKEVKNANKVVGDITALLASIRIEARTVHPESVSLDAK